MSLNVAFGPLLLFVLVASITPGPNNLLLMRSGANFGVRRSTAHLVGIQLGCMSLLVLCYLGTGAMLLSVPAAFTVLHWACFAYLLYLAAMIFLEGNRIPGAAQSAASSGRPMHWYEASAFQLINPKAWMMAITVASAFYGSQAPGAAEISVAALSWLAIGFPSMMVWIVWGASIDRVLKRRRERQIYAWVMSLAVAATAVWMVR